MLYKLNSTGWVRKTSLQKSCLHIRWGVRVNEAYVVVNRRAGSRASGLGLLPVLAGPAWELALDLGRSPVRVG